MTRYKTAFYQPLVTDASNFGTWTEAGSLSATDRARGLWQSILQDFQPPETAATCAAPIGPFIERRTAEGGAPLLASQVSLAVQKMCLAVALPFESREYFRTTRGKADLRFCRFS